MAPVLLVYAMAATAAGPLKTFKDWTVGCDNGRNCMAVGQFNSANYDLASLVVERGPLANDVPKIWFRNDQGTVIDLAADGKRLNVELIPFDEDTSLLVAPESVPEVVAAIIGAKALVPVRTDKGEVFPLSISGASAALRWIDQSQDRVGTVTAMVAKGPRPASAVPLPPDLPKVRQAVPSGAIGRKLTTEEIRALQEEYAECSDEDVSDKADYARLDAHTTLAVVTAVCGSGAYNYYGIPLLLRSSAKPVLAKFEDRKGEDGDMPMNLSWDDKTHVLSSYFKGRGLGDCGGATDWVWDGAMFRVIKSTVMDECLGAIAWIPTFRATPEPRP